MCKCCVTYLLTYLLARHVWFCFNRTNHEFLSAWQSSCHSYPPFEVGRRPTAASRLSCSNSRCSYRPQGRTLFFRLCIFCLHFVYEASRATLWSCRQSSKVFKENNSGKSTDMKAFVHTDMKKLGMKRYRIKEEIRVPTETSLLILVSIGNQFFNRIML